MNIGLGEVFALSAALTWAIAIVLFKKSGEQVPPFALNILKNGFVLPLFIVTIVVVHGLQWPGLALAEWPVLVVSALIGIVLGDTLYFRALNAIGASRMAVTQTLYSPFVIALSLAFLGERLSVQQFIGVLVVLGGIWLVTIERHRDVLDRQRLRQGVLYGVLAVLAMAIGVVMIKPLLERHDLLWIVALRIAFGFSGMLLIIAWRGEFGVLKQAYAAVHHWPPIVAGAFIGNYLSTMIWLAGYKYTQASIAAVLNEVSAVMILPLAAIFLHEPVRRRQWVGVLAALSGVALVVAG